VEDVDIIARIVRRAKKSPVRAGGALYVLNSANYGSLTINKAVAIISEDAISGVLATNLVNTEKTAQCAARLNISSRGLLDVLQQLLRVPD
jgi:hypothetical protein